MVDKFAVLIQTLRNADDKLAISVQPVLTDAHEEEYRPTAGEVLKACIYGTAHMIRTIEEETGEVGVYMKSVIDGLNELYIETDVDVVQDEELKRRFRLGNEPGEQKDGGDSRSEWEPPH